MVHELDSLLDGLASALGRSVVIADRHQRLISYSAEHGDADAIRVATILNRASPPAMQEFVSSLGIERTHDVTRTPPNRRLGSEARVCIPVRHDERLLGFLWLIDSHEDLSESDLQMARRDAEYAAEILMRTERLEDETRARERRLLEGLLSSSPAERAEAAAAAAVRDVFDVGTYARAVVVVPPHDAAHQLRDDLAAVEDRARRFWPTRRLLTAVRDGHCVLLLACGADDDVQVRAFATRVRSALETRDAVSGSCAAGIGSLHELHELHAGAEEAVRAASVALAIPKFGGIGEWDALGAYRVLASVTTQVSAIDPMVGRLLAADTDGSLVFTLETYLDLAGDVKATSSALVLHRTSLYYRLRKVESVIGASLRDGEVRLALQLGLKLARLHGQLPSGVETHFKAS